MFEEAVSKIKKNQPLTREYLLNLDCQDLVRLLGHSETMRRNLCDEQSSLRVKLANNKMNIE